jgi:hypothetical protein
MNQSQPATIDQHYTPAIIYMSRLILTDKRTTQQTIYSRFKSTWKVCINKMVKVYLFIYYSVNTGWRT